MAAASAHVPATLYSFVAMAPIQTPFSQWIAGRPAARKSRRAAPSVTPCGRRPSVSQGALCSSGRVRSALAAPTGQRPEAAERQQAQGRRLGDDVGLHVQRHDIALHERQALEVDPDVVIVERNP